MQTLTIPDTTTEPPGPEPAADPTDPRVNRAWALRIRAADPSALEALFRATHEPLVRYAHRFVTPETASDVVQDAFVRIWEGRGRLDPDRSLRALAFRTVRNLSLNRIRDGKTRAALVGERSDFTSAGAPSPDAEFMGRDLATQLEAWIADLPERQREALTLTRLQGLSHREVAEVMDVSERTVNNHLVRALRMIRDRVRAYDPTLLES